MPGLTGYFGGKNSMSPWIYSNIPKDIDLYCEVFGGSFAIYFNEDFSHVGKIIYNDANKHQSNFMACCRDYEEMISKIEKSFLPGGFLHYGGGVDEKKKYYRDLYTNMKNPNLSDFYTNLDFDIPDLDRATIYSYMITSAFNSCHALGAGFSGFTKTGKLKMLTLLNKLRNNFFRSKLDGISDVQCLDFEEVFSKYDSESSFFYLDPPYKKTNGVGTHDIDYGSIGIFGDVGHERLAKSILGLKSRWALSYYYFPELEEWFPKSRFRWINKEFFRSSSSFSEGSLNKGNEILIMNYD